MCVTATRSGDTVRSGGAAPRSAFCHVCSHNVSLLIHRTKELCLARERPNSKEFFFSPPGPFFLKKNLIYTTACSGP